MAIATNVEGNCMARSQNDAHGQTGGRAYHAGETVLALVGDYNRSGCKLTEKFNQGCVLGSPVSKLPRTSNKPEVM